MNDLFSANAPITMSSREIAEVCEKEHRNVLSDIRKMLDELGKTSAEFSADLPDAYGRLQPGFHLPKRETLILVSGYSVELRARIIDRWQELETKVMAPSAIDVRNPATLTTIALQLIGVNKELSEKVEELTPKAVAHDRIADAHGTFNRTTAAKMLGVAPHTLIRWMRTNGWIYKRPGTPDDIAYQSKIEAGLLEHKIQTGPRPDGTEWSSTSVRVTPKGLTVLAKAFPPAASLAG